MPGAAGLPASPASPGAARSGRLDWAVATGGSPERAARAGRAATVGAIAARARIKPCRRQKNRYCKLLSPYALKSVWLVYVDAYHSRQVTPKFILSLHLLMKRRAFFWFGGAPFDCPWRAPDLSLIPDGRSPWAGRRAMTADQPGVARRQVLQGVLQGLGSLPLAAVLANPVLAQATAETLAEVTIETADGRTVSGALALPETLPAPAVIAIHEWWGLNDQIKTVTAELARQGYVALAVDLYDGVVADTRERASALVRSVDDAEATDTMAAWVDWLRAHEATTGRLGTVGWCFGGGWSLNTAVAAPVDACVVYYGRCDRPAEAMARLQGPVLGHFATQDGYIDAAMVDRFADAMNAAARSYTVHWYEADHAFANPTGARYDAADARLAWERTLDFLGRHLRA
ncbi:hypothetical protein CCR80_08785 [Rhodothalassium salexigens]|nr:hypothetical protein [Rhodothalassium salexigens]